MATMMTSRKNTRRRSSVALLSVASNSFLIILKMIVGLMIGSVSVFSEAIHSGVDWLAAIIAWFAVRQADKPEDESHPFGHGKFENISGTVEALLIFIVAGWIIFEAIHKLRHPAPLEYLFWGVAVMALSSILNTIVSHFLFKIGRETHSMALLADAWHLRTDVYTSAGVMVGLILIWIGEEFFPARNLYRIDPIAAILVALLIIRAAYSLTVQSARDLVDTSLPVEEEKWIRQCIQNFSHRISGFHRLRTRKSGARRFVEFHMIVDPGMSVQASHAMAEELNKKIKNHFAQTTVLVHVEPCDGKCPPHCVKGCFLPEEVSTSRKNAVGPTPIG